MSARSAIAIAAAAKAKSAGVEKLIGAVSNHMVTLGASVEALRAENAEQHRENALRLAKGLDAIGQRFDTLETQVAADKQTNASKWEAAKDKLIYVMGALIVTLMSIFIVPQLVGGG